MTARKPAQSQLSSTLKARGKSYGDFSDVADVAQKLKRVIGEELHARDKHLAPDQHEALSMICSKLARIINGDPDLIDNWHDIAGYATLVETRLSEEQL